MGTPVVGIIGGGQLARMMHGASIGLGIKIALLAEGPDVSAAQVVHDVSVGDYTDQATVLAFAKRCDVVTFDHEHVPPALLAELQARGVLVRPGCQALVHAQDKVIMRTVLADHGIPVPEFAVVDSVESLIEFGERTGWPVIAKASRGGYDGKGVWKIDDAAHAFEPFENLAPDVAILAEEYIPFTRELSAIVARSSSGQGVAYPISESTQVDGICVETTTPAPNLTEEQATDCQRMALEIARDLEVTGILAVELMQCTDGSVVVNELAMRPHNTGHWSIDGAITDQFENHLRGVLDLPLGDPSARATWTVMCNVLGGTRSDLVDGLRHVLARDPGLRVQLYGKEVVPGRKVGHVTAMGADLEDVRRRARQGASGLRSES